MSDPEEEQVPERPATWENVVIGKGEELLGKIIRDDEMAEEGEEMAEAAHEVREEYREEKAD